MGERPDDWSDACLVAQAGTCWGCARWHRGPPQLLIVTPRTSPSAESGAVLLVPGSRQRKASSADQPPKFARTRKSANIMTASRSKRKIFGHIAGRAFRGATRFSVACDVERTRGAACADWLGSAKAPCATAVRYFAAASSEEFHTKIGARLEGQAPVSAFLRCFWRGDGLVRCSGTSARRAWAVRKGPRLPAALSCACSPLGSGVSFHTQALSSCPASNKKL